MIKNPEGFFRFGTINSISRNIRAVSVYFSSSKRLESFISRNIRNFAISSENTRNFFRAAFPELRLESAGDIFFRKYKKSFLCRKYKNFFNLRVRKFHFLKYKEFFSGRILFLFFGAWAERFRFLGFPFPEFL